MNRSLSSPAQLLGRLLMAVIFILGGWGKFNGHEAAVGYIAKNGIPMPEVAYWVSVAVELLGGLAILVGLQTRAVSLAMAIFCVATAVMVHYHPEDRGQMTNFLKNLCMAGGFLQLYAVGAGGWSLDSLFSRRS